MKSLAAADRKSLIRLASSLPKGDKGRRAILAGLKRIAASSYVLHRNPTIGDYGKEYGAAFLGSNEAFPDGRNWSGDLVPRLVTVKFLKDWADFNIIKRQNYKSLSPFYVRPASVSMGKSAPARPKFTRKGTWVVKRADGKYAQVPTPNQPFANEVTWTNSPNLATIFLPNLAASLYRELTKAGVDTSGYEFVQAKVSEGGAIPLEKLLGEMGAEETVEEVVEPVAVEKLPEARYYLEKPGFGYYSVKRRFSIDTPVTLTVKNIINISRAYMRKGDDPNLWFAIPVSFKAGKPVPAQFRGYPRDENILLQDKKSGKFARFPPGRGMKYPEWVSIRDTPSPVTVQKAQGFIRQRGMKIFRGDVNAALAEYNFVPVTEVQGTPIALGDL